MLFQEKQYANEGGVLGTPIRPNEQASLLAPSVTILGVTGTTQASLLTPSVTILGVTGTTPSVTSHA